MGDYIFLSGPITGVPDYKEKFRKAAEKVAKYFPCHEIINPAELDDVMPGATHKDYMSVCLNELLPRCGSIVQLPGWEQSAGACMEYGWAVANDLIIIGLGEISEKEGEAE